MFVDPVSHFINGLLLVGQGLLILLLLLKLRQKENLIYELRRSLTIMQDRNRSMLSRVLESSLHTEQVLDESLQPPTHEPHKPCGPGWPNKCVSNNRNRKI